MNIFERVGKIVLDLFNGNKKDKPFEEPKDLSMFAGSTQISKKFKKFLAESQEPKKELTEEEKWFRGTSFGGGGVANQHQQEQEDYPMHMPGGSGGSGKIHTPFVTINLEAYKRESIDLTNKDLNPDLRKYKKGGEYDRKYI